MNTVVSFPANVIHFSLNNHTASASGVQSVEWNLCMSKVDGAQIWLFTRTKSGQFYLSSYSNSLIMLKKWNYISKGQVAKSEVLFNADSKPSSFKCKYSIGNTMT